MTRILVPNTPLMTFGNRSLSAVAPVGADDGAVLRRDVVEPVGEAEAAGALHVLGDDRRIARDVLAEVARDQAAVDVVAAADARADDHLDRLAFVEVGRA